MLSINEIRASLPKVGDHLMEVPTVVDSRSGGPASRGYYKEPMPCKVIEVNRAGLWYRVEFDNGTKECYKLPKTKWTQPRGGGR